MVYWLSFPKLGNLHKKCITISVCFESNKDYNHINNILKLFIVGQVNLIAMFVKIHYLVSVHLRNTDFSYVRPTWNSNLPKRPYVSNVKANISPKSCYRNEYSQESRVMSSFPEHSVPLNFTASCRLSYSEGQKKLMCQFCEQ